MRFIRFSCCLILFPLMTKAQNKPKAKLKKYFYHSHGISFQKFDNLNKRIVAYPQFEQPKNSTGTLQFGMFAERNRLITSYSINAGSSISGDRDKRSANTGYFGLSADVGYNLLKSTRISLYPFAGLGYETFKVKFNRDVSTIPFDSVLLSNNAQQGVENLVFNNSFMIYRLGVGMVFTSKKNVRNSIGLQVDYSGSFKENDWKINKSQTLLNSPKDMLSKIAMRLLIRYQLKQRG